MSAAVPRLSARGVRKVFPADGAAPLVAIDDLGFDVAAGELVCLVGPSGCGKSTLLNIVAGLETGFEGEVLLDGVPLGRDHAGARPRIAYVFQEPRLLPWLTVERNVHFGLDCQGIARAEWHHRTARVLAMVGLGSYASLYPHQLSGGMQQRTAIARAFAIDPDVLLMDEPFSGLDEFTARDLRQQLLEIWGQTHKTIVFVTHNSFEATFLADRILLITRRPARVFAEIPVALTRPRDYDDPRVFEVNRTVVSTFLGGIGTA